MSEPIHDPELKAVEAALIRLQPATPALDRDRLMFQAGQASRPPRSWVWPASTAALALVCAGLTIAFVQRPEPSVVEKIVYIKEPVPSTSGPSESSFVSHQGWSDYQRLQEQVLKNGLEALPEPTPAAVSPYPHPLDEMFGEPGLGWPRPNRTGT